MTEKGIKQVDILNLSQPFQKKLQIKMGKSALSQYVNDVQSPDQNRLFLLSQTLRVSEAWLMGFDVPQTDQIEIVHENNTHESEKVDLQKILQPELELSFGDTLLTADQARKLRRLLNVYLIDALNL
jgi:transcriptional regulator with XRE-family HTH domain